MTYGPVLCAFCLDFGHLANLGPCPHCQPDTYTTYLETLRRTARHHHGQPGDDWDRGDPA